jgi:predicted ABC-type ATPase
MFTDHQVEILRILSLNGETALSMTELGRIMSCAPGVFQRGLNGLEKSGLIISERSGRKRMIRLNSDSLMASAVAASAHRPHAAHPAYGYRPLKTQVAEPTPAYDAAELKVLIIAGPNGAGKSTFARRFLDDPSTGRHFVNADNIAAGLSPFNPAYAARQAAVIMINEVERHVMSRHHFAVETTLSGLRYRRQIDHWHRAGYRVKILFLSLPSAELAIERVACRVAQGGHDIPVDTIKRRFERGLDNIHQVYKPLCDAWAYYDSSGMVPHLIEEGER